MKRFILFTICLFACQSNFSYSIDGVDISYQQNGNNKTFQIVAYDIYNQRVKSVDFIRGKDEQLDSLLQENHVAADYGIEIYTDGSVVLTEGFNGDLLVRAKGSIDTNLFDVPEDYYLFDIRGFADYFDKRYSSVYRSREIRDGDSILDQLQLSSPSRMSTDLELSVNSNYLRGVPTLSSISNDQRCSIGEISTELTMLSFGYDQCISKYRGNKGLDGVFVDRSNTPKYFITESKCRGEKVTAENYLRDELNERKIHRKIQNGLEEQNPVRRSMQELDHFILQNRAPTFKFAHRTIMSGRSQSALAILDHEEYARLSGVVTINSLAESLQGLSIAQRR